MLVADSDSEDETSAVQSVQQKASRVFSSRAAVQAGALLQTHSELSSNNELTDERAALLQHVAAIGGPYAELCKGFGCFSVLPRRLPCTPHSTGSAAQLVQTVFDTACVKAETVQTAHTRRRRLRSPSPSKNTQRGGVKTADDVVRNRQLKHDLVAPSSQSHVARRRRVYGSRSPLPSNEASRRGTPVRPLPEALVEREEGPTPCITVQSARDWTDQCARVSPIPLSPQEETQAVYAASLHGSSPRTQYCLSQGECMAYSLLAMENDGGGEEEEEEVSVAHDCTTPSRSAESSASLTMRKDSSPPRILFRASSPGLLRDSVEQRRDVSNSFSPSDFYAVDADVGGSVALARSKRRRTRSPASLSRSCKGTTAEVGAALGVGSLSNSPTAAAEKLTRGRSSRPAVCTPLPNSRRTPCHSLMDGAEGESGLTRYLSAAHVGPEEMEEERKNGGSGTSVESAAQFGALPALSATVIQQRNVKAERELRRQTHCALSLPY